MKLLAANLVLLFATACGDVIQNQVDPTAFHDATDQSTCNQTAHEKQSIYGQWFSRQVDGDGNEIQISTTIVQASNGDLTIYGQKCIWPGLTQDISLTVNSSATDTQYQIKSHNAATPKTDLDKNGVQRTCSLEVFPAIWNYAQKGHCILLSDPQGNQSLLVHPPPPPQK